MKQIPYFVLAILITACGDQQSEKESANAESTLTTKDSLASQSISSTQSEEQVMNDSTQQLLNDSTNALIDSLNAISEKDSIEASTYFAIIPEKLLEQGLIKQEEIPTVKEIGIKPPPDSYAINIGEPFEYNGKTYKTVEMVSADSVESILAFYKKWKKQWHYVEKGSVHTFKKEKDTYFRETNNLQIQPFTLKDHPMADTLVSFTPHSYIFIYYEVKGNS